LSDHKEEFIFDYKLIECGIMSSVRSSVKVKLKALGLLEGKEYQLRDISELVKVKLNIRKFICYHLRWRHHTKIFQKNVL
jgi:hypothetical protein